MPKVGNKIAQSGGVYLDYAATTPVALEVLKTMLPYFSRHFGNPGSLHHYGQEALQSVDESRDAVARFLNCQPREVIFAASATEANNLALRGVIKAYGKRAKLPHIITSKIEHESVLATCQDLEREGLAEISYLGVSREGFVRHEELKAVLRPETVLISIMYANNEIGTIQPIADIGRVVTDFRKSAGQAIYPLFHSDAAQAAQFLDVDVKKLGVDFITVSGHKMYGPKGIACLYVRTGGIRPIITGGDQEYGLRSGTENVSLIVGLGKAVELAAMNRAKATFQIKNLREELWRAIIQLKIKVERHGAEPLLPNILNVSFPGISGEELLFRLDRAGVAASTGSACRSRSVQTSFVLSALGLGEATANSAVRFSLGRPTTHADILRTAKILKTIF